MGATRTFGGKLPDLVEIEEQKPSGFLGIEMTFIPCLPSCESTKVSGISLCSNGVDNMGKQRSSPCLFCQSLAG